MKKIILIVLIIVLLIPLTANAQTYSLVNPVKITDEMVIVVNELRDNATTQKEFSFAIKMEKMISNPSTITAGLGIDPNGQYNYGHSVYEVDKQDSQGTTWKRVGYK